MSRPFSAAEHGAPDSGQPVGYFCDMRKDEIGIQIVGAAIELFWKSRYHTTDMNAPSDAAGMIKATARQHFRSKEVIASAAVDRALERIGEWVFKSGFGPIVADFTI